MQLKDFVSTALDNCHSYADLGTCLVAPALPPRHRAKLTGQLGAGWEADPGKQTSIHIVCNPNIYFLTHAFFFLSRNNLNVSIICLSSEMRLS